MLCITIVVTYSFLSLPAILFYTLVQQDSYSYYEVPYCMHDMAIINVYMTLCLIIKVINRDTVIGNRLNYS